VLQYGFGTTSVAAILVALSPAGVAAILVKERLARAAMFAELQARFPEALLEYDRSATEDALKVVTEFVERPQANISLPLVIHGTPFQHRVWDAVLNVPFGTTTTFTEIARRAGSPRAVRAVGSACTRNPLEFAIPCHRVLRSNGTYSGGSAWGDRRQAAIVEREAASLTSKSTRKTQRNKR
jgi:AraC family transcriptional regulator of adaptative response/methylated-DNA-[protein]-cysteine methyltransferase